MHRHNITHATGCPAIIVDTAHAYVSHFLWATSSVTVLCVMVAGRQALPDDVSVA